MRLIVFYNYRDKLISSQSGPQEYRFNGRSHVTVPGRRYLTEQKNHVLLFFRTYAPDGLIYLVGEGAYFFSIQMQDGKVYLQVSDSNILQCLMNFINYVPKYLSVTQRSRS